jgi:hypothetical protein
LNLEHATAKAVRSSFGPKDKPTAAASLTPKVVLKEVFELLEDYAPAWYTEEIHDRIKTALSDYH